MNRTVKFTIVGAISSMVALPAVAGATAPQAPAVPPGQSFSDLLQPISDPVQKLRASDAQEIARSRGVELIQTRWHHHHHHHHYWRGGYGYSYGYTAPYRCWWRYGRHYCRRW
jgi:hypothetical protein